MGTDSMVNFPTSNRMDFCGGLLLDAVIYLSNVAKFMKLPLFHLDLFDYTKMLISTYKCQAVLFCKGGNPDVVFRNWVAFRAEMILYVSVMSGGISVAAKHSAFQCKIIDVDNVRFTVSRLVGTIVKFAEYNGRDKCLWSGGKLLKYV